MPANVDIASASVAEAIADSRANVPKVINRLFDILYKDFHRVARELLRANGQPIDLSATMLLHETYERLVQLDELKVSDRQQFFTYAAAVMRSVIVDMARSRLTARRGAGVYEAPIDTTMVSNLASPLDETVVQIHEALDQLAHVVEMRYFAGLSLHEIAQTMGVTERTVSRDWNKAKALLAAMVNR